MIYDAFISYRHVPLDMEFAKKVHTGLETYHVPGAVQKKTGKKKIQRVFRDQEELPIGSDLNDNIATALRESEFLIVICSPETPGSYWVSKEIETFIALHDRQHVLAVLVDGEPAQSFPPLLLSDENGNSIEPLAADVRGATPAERNKKFKTELLRLAAPVLGCTYDDLRQRHRERILKRNLLIAGVAAGIIAVAGAAFGVYQSGVADRMKKLADEKAVLAEEKSVLADDKTRLADEMSVLAGEKSKLADEMKDLADEKTRLADEILVEYREKQVNQARFYAEEAMLQLAEGNREDAVLIAAAGLPSEDSERPFVAEAEYALAAALHAYDFGDTLDFDRILSHDMTVSTMSVDRSGRYLTSVDNGNTVYVWDCERWELLLKIPPVVTDNDYRDKVIAAFANESGLIVAYESNLVKYDLSGAVKTRWESEHPCRACSFFDEYNAVFCFGAYTLNILSLADLTPQAEIANEPGDNYAFDCGISKDGQRAAVCHAVKGSEHAQITVWDRTTGTTVSAPVSMEYILNLTVTDSGNVAVVSTNSDFYHGMKALMLDVFRASDGELLYSREIPQNIRDLSTFRLLLSSHSYNGGSDIVITAEGDAFSYDETSGELKNRILLSGAAVTLDISEGSSTAFIGCINGDILAVNTNTGRIYTDDTVSTNVALEDMKIINGGIVLRRPRSVGILAATLHEGAGLTALPDLTSDAFGYAVAPSAQYFVLSDAYKLGGFDFYDRNGERIYSVTGETGPIATGFYGDSFVLAGYTDVRLINPANGGSVTEYGYKEIGAENAYTGGCVSRDGRILAVWGTYGISVINLAEGRCICTEKNLTPVGTAAFGCDGNRLLISRAGSPLVVMELPSGEWKELPDTALSQVADCRKLPYLACDSVGRYAAMACADGFVRILSSSSWETLHAIPLQVQKDCFLAFTKDAEYLIIQGDDFLVRIYRVSDGACVNSFDAPARVAYMVEDGDRIALCDYYTVSLVDAESFGRLAYVPRACTYLSDGRTFVLLSGRKVRSVGYKDYRELLAEAQRQFPGAKLSEEKKVTYNID